jgi:hypothetical protein
MVPATEAEQSIVAILQARERPEERRLPVQT